MSKINWKVRFKNKTFVVVFLTTIIAFIYQMLSLFGVTPKISEDMVVNVVMAIINALTALGVIIDPTTRGIEDSKRALGYNDPQ